MAVIYDFKQLLLSLQILIKLNFIPSFLSNTDKTFLAPLSSITGGCFNLLLKLEKLVRDFRLKKWQRVCK